MVSGSSDQAVMSAGGTGTRVREHQFSTSAGLGAQDETRSAWLGAKALSVITIGPARS